jgi:hypothetical protein
MERFAPNNMIVEFDEADRIVHLSVRKPRRMTTGEHLEQSFANLRSILDEYIAEGRVYLIIDMSNIIIEPDLKSMYATQAHAISEKYIMPHGIARYGYQITRVTVRTGYTDHLQEEPNIFNSREEAYAYIRGLIAGCKNQTISTAGH